MQKVVIKRDPGEILWPKKCASCCADIDDSKEHNVNMKLSDECSVKFWLCEDCKKKIKGYQTFQGIGGIFVLLAIAGIFFSGTDVLYYRLGQGGTFWLGMIFVWIGQAKINKTINAVKGQIYPDNKFNFFFRSKDYRDEFVRMNNL